MRQRACQSWWFLSLTIAGIAVPSAAEAQLGTVRGRVIDAATRRGIPETQVVVVGTGNGALTSGDGEFTITAVPPCSNTGPGTRWEATGRSSRCATPMARHS